MTSYRVYGPAEGVGSFVTITRGFLEGLTDLGCDVSHFSTNLHDDEDRPVEGSTADVAIWLGWPAHCINMLFFGRHKKRLVMVAPNSTRTPPFVFNLASRADARLITPSQWGRSVLDAQVSGSVERVVHHGVGKEFGAWREGAEINLDRSRDTIRFLHVASTTAERKGTMEMLQAWEKLMARGYPGSLTICTDEAGRTYLARQRVPGGVSILIQRAGSMPAFMDQFDVIVQPSRAEGFGLCPLEAACLGKPVIMTTYSGHADFADAIVHVPVRSGPYAAIMDYEGSTAPSVDPADIFVAFETLREQFYELTIQAWKRHKIVFDEWRWSSVLMDFTRQEETDRCPPTASHTS